MGKVFGYCRISTKQQSIDRQERNILQEFPSAKIRKEAYTGRRMDRPEWSSVRKEHATGTLQRSTISTTNHEQLNSDNSTCGFS